MKVNILNIMFNLYYTLNEVFLLLNDSHMTFQAVLVNVESSLPQYVFFFFCIFTGSKPDSDVTQSVAQNEADTKVSISIHKYKNIEKAL